MTPRLRSLLLFAVTLCLLTTALLSGAAGNFAVASWSAIEPMLESRSGAAAARLADGTVLVAGGDSGSGATNSAEIYDLMNGRWTATDALLDARAGHTMTVLADGRIAVIGGAGSGGVLNTVEIFDPATGARRMGRSLMTARRDHGAALLPDGRVLVVGGTDGSNALASTEMVDFESGEVTAGPELPQPRTGVTASALLNGRVLIAGGNNGEQDLASTLIYNPTDGSLAAGGSLKAARSGHTAAVLPNNNSVLIAGGKSGDAELNSAELYVYWQNATKTTGSMASARTGAAAAGTGAEGVAVVAGGAGQSAEAYGFATVKTDADDYAPGDTVYISGSGWEPGESVTLALDEAPLLHARRVMTAVADASGKIANSDFAPESHDIGVRFYLTATGQQSGRTARMTFTDSPKVGAVTVGAQTGTLSAGTAGSATYTVTVTRGSVSGSTGSYTANVTVSGLPSGVSAGPLAITLSSSDSSKSGTLTISTTAAALATAGTSFTVVATRSDNVTDNASGTGSLVIGAPAKSNQTITVTTAAPTSAAYGSGFNVAANASSGLDVAITTTGACSGSGTGNASITMTAATGTCTVKYNQAGDSSYFAAPEVTSNTEAGKATVTGSFTAANKVYDGTIAATITSRSIASGVVGTDTVTLTGGTATFDTKNVGEDKTVTGTGFTLAGSDEGKYQLASTTLATTADITQRAITVTAVTDSKTYDGTTSSDETPSVTTGTIAAGDTANFSQAFDNKHVGTAKTLTPSGSVTDGNSGNNYAVTFSPVSTGVITARAITVTAVADSKTYDGDTSSDETPTVTTGSLAAGDTGNFTQAFDNKNVGTGKTLTPSGSVTDGNSGNNYAVTFSPVTTGVITARAITVTAVGDSKTYDGNTSSDKTPTVTTGTIVAGDTGNFTQAFDNKNVGTGKTLTPSGSVSDGNSGNNYAVTFAAVHTGVITAKGLTVTGITADDKYYDTNTIATLNFSGAALVGVVAGDSVSLNTSGATGAFNNASVGNNKPVSITGLALSGTDSGNYSLTQPTTTASILAWTLRGFYHPVDMGAAVLNTVKGGSTVPLKFEIFKGATASTESTDIADIKSFTYGQIACGASTVEDAIEVVTTGGTSLRYDSIAGQFIQNWQTLRTPGKCYGVVMETQDGSKIVGYFKMK